MARKSSALTRRMRRLGLLAGLLGAGAWFAPWPTLVFLAFGGLDVARHRRLTWTLAEEYFTGKGLGAWLLSPVNLLADLLAYGGRSPIRLEDLPEAHRREIQACVDAFRAAGQDIRARLAGAGDARTMLTFQWFGRDMAPALRIAAFQRPYAQVKTIAVSTFRPDAATSWHFGPQRLTFRVLCCLDPIESRGAFVAVDDQIHYWADGPLLAFDDTLFHRSVNGQAEARCCLFLDVVRPNRAPWLFQTALGGLGRVAGPFKAVFYRNWAFLR